MTTYLMWYSSRKALTLLSGITTSYRQSGGRGARKCRDQCAFGSLCGGVAPPPQQRPVAYSGMCPVAGAIPGLLPCGTVTLLWGQFSPRESNCKSAHHTVAVTSEGADFERKLPGHNAPAVLALDGDDFEHLLVIVKSCKAGRRHVTASIIKSSN